MIDGVVWFSMMMVSSSSVLVVVLAVVLLLYVFPESGVVEVVLRLGAATEMSVA